MCQCIAQGWVGRQCEGLLVMYCRCYTLCNSRRCGSMWQCLSVVDNVMFLMLNEDKDFEIRTSQTTNRTKRHKRRHLKQKDYLSRQIPLHLHAWSPVHCYLTTCVPLHQQITAYLSVTWLYVWVCFECKRMCAGEHPAQSHHYDPHPQTS